MQKIGLVTCSQFPNLTEVDQKLIPLFLDHDVIAEPVVWNDPSVIWEAFYGLVFRSTWDYYLLHEEFIQWLNKIETLNIITYNSIPVIKKNIHKYYLQEFEKEGIKIIPSIFIHKNSSFDLINTIPNSWDSIIIKPAISAGSYLTELFLRDEMLKIKDKYAPISYQKDLIIQKFIPDIQISGEISMIFFNKIYSHAVVKKPKNGDFRIQSQFGGIYRKFEPSSTLIKTARIIIDQIDEDLSYARVDGIIIDGVFHLMELELIEPDLYFNYAVGSNNTFVNGIVTKMKSRI